MNVLAIGAHPDDIQLHCGGTLARYAGAGHGVTFLAVCNAPGLSADEARQAQAEARDAAALIGATAHCLGYPDHRLPTDDSVLFRLVDFIRQANPAVVLSHDPGDCFVDHLRVSRLVEDAISMAPAPNVESPFPPTSHHPCLFYMDTVVGLSFLPTDYVDITSVISAKRRMIECHRTRVSRSFDNPHDASIMEMMEVAARFRGIQCGVRYAEAFRMQPKWDRTATWQVLP